MRPAVFFVAGALFLAVPAQHAFAGPTREADSYFYVRDKAHLADGYTQDEIQTQPQKYAGKLLEVRGTIKGIAVSDSHTTLVLGGDEGPGLAIALPADKPLSTWPFLSIGAEIRALCQVVTVMGSPNGSLELRIPVKEYDAAIVDKDRQKAEQEAARRAAALRQSSTPRTLGSRGVGAGPVRRAGGLTDMELVTIYANAIHYFNKRLADSTARNIAWNIIRYSRDYGLDARLVMAVIACESNFNPYAVSSKGAMGLGQLMPGTAGDLGVGNAYDPSQNLGGSVRLLRTHIQNMAADGRPTEEAIKLALACYNAGAGAVKKYNGIPPYRETQNYVAKITRLYRQLCGQGD